MSSTIVKPQHSQEGAPRLARSPSRPNVRHITSHISRAGPRPVITGLRAKSPALTTPNAMTAKPPASPEPIFSKSEDPSRSNSLGEISDGVGNLNRWSQSTGSSESSGIAGHKRSGSFARRLSGSFIGASSSSKSVLSTASSSATVVQVGYSLPIASPQLLAPRLPSKATSGRYSPSITLSALSLAVETATTGLSDEAMATSPGIMTHATYMPGSTDYFGKGWETPTQQKISHQEELVESTPSANASSDPRIHPGANNSFAEGSRHSRGTVPQNRGEHRRRDRDSSSRHSGTRHRDRSQKRSGSGDGDKGSRSGGHGDKPRRRKGPSQKAMLSRALQMANHAVVLDHAQNFEGAMDAYGDACDLLQQVMLRSPRDEDRRNLESIVSS